MTQVHTLYNLSGLFWVYSTLCLATKQPWPSFHSERIYPNCQIITAGLSFRLSLSLSPAVSWSSSGCVPDLSNIPHSTCYWSPHSTSCLRLVISCSLLAGESVGFNKALGEAGEQREKIPHVSSLSVSLSLTQHCLGSVNVQHCYCTCSGKITCFIHEKNSRTHQPPHKALIKLRHWFN